MTTSSRTTAVPVRKAGGLAAVCLGACAAEGAVRAATRTTDTERMSAQTTPPLGGRSTVSGASDAGDAIDLHQRVSGDPARGGDGRPHARLGPELAQEDLVHAGVVLQVVQVDVDLQDLLHRRARGFELLLDLVEHVRGVALDVALEVRADAGDEQQVAVGDRGAEERLLLGPRS